MRINISAYFRRKFRVFEDRWLVESLGKLGSFNRPKGAMSFVVAGFRNLLRYTSRIHSCFSQITSEHTATGFKNVPLHWSIPKRCLTLPPERESGLKKRGKFQPSAWKRLHKFGLENALASQSGRRRLFNRYLKGRHNLTVYDDFLAVKPRYAKSKKELKHERSVPKPLRSKHNA